MGMNQTVVTGFILLGFTNRNDILVILFIVFLVIYVFTLLGNFCIIAVTFFNTILHKPMYFFLGNLAFLDIIYSTVIAPKMLSTFLMKDKSITYTGCVVQMFLFAVLITTESVLLAIMAYDRYLAICNPLRYPAIMTTRFCAWLISGAYLNASLHSLLHTYILSHLTYCEDRLIPHFFCDVTPLIKLSCSSTALAELLIYTEGSLAANIPFLFILISYVLITRDIVKMKNSSSRSKAFSSPVLLISWSFACFMVPTFSFTSVLHQTTHLSMIALLAWLTPSSHLC
ncbi:unnamed protein product [Staurois parvus]|uniref:Olfactory receptor n=1 Tax=Staurois parvus TaxID=386267 RepID=A0ABN9H501_9NEOB|nr:unnamed protein product [Staurois parvus]